MNSQKILFYKYTFCLVLMFRASTCYPVDKLNADQPELKDETRYPNGTVVGKYTYTDNEGNPIHVKYYADDASYGVELKSVKMVDTSTDESAWQPNNFDTLKPIEPSFGLASELLTFTNPDSKQKKTDLKNKDDKKMNLHKKDKSSDYETFYQNDIKSSRQCDKGKVRVYLDKEKKIIKRALDNYQATRYCDQF